LNPIRPNVALGAVLGKLERRVLEDGDEVGETVDHLLTGAELGRWLAYLSLTYLMKRRTRT
jgi:hypothetical protein